MNIIIEMIMHANRHPEWWLYVTLGSVGYATIFRFVENRK